jgi:micrococcal nuclease
MRNPGKYRRKSKMKKSSIWGLSAVFLLSVGIISGYLNLALLWAESEGGRQQGATEQGVSKCLRESLDMCQLLPTAEWLSCIIQVLLACLNDEDIEIPSPLCPSVFYENNRVALVTQVIDGDTVELEGGERVRYIGIDTPEEGEVGFEEATQRNAELVVGQTVTLDICEEQPEDEFGRTLAYVIVDSIVVNEVLLAEGLADPLHIPPCGNETAECYQQLPPDEDTRECDPSYPTVCIPPPPPDLDCGDIPYSNFPVLPPDPHGFDGDGDGIGCEQ